MKANPVSQSSGPDRRILSIIIVVLASAVFVFTWIGIRENRHDSFALLELQGKSFTEALAQSSENAILSESYYDQMVQARYGDLVAFLAEEDLASLTDDDLVSFAQGHDLYGAYVFGVDSLLVAGVVARGPGGALPLFVEEEVAQLISDPESNYVLLLDQSEPTDAVVHYYLELTNRMDRVVVIVVDALYYSQALEQTGIGFLARSMAREPGVEYIIYQSTDGIIFSSRRPGSLLAIESDAFLTQALDSDSISGRLYDFQGTEVLELVRPFSSARYPFGLFRVGLSLEGYYLIARGYNLQMVALSAVLFGLVLVAILYLNSREKRRVINRRYTRIKSITDKIFEQMQTGVAVIDRTGEIRLVNRAFEKTFNLVEAAGKRFDEVVSCDILDLGQNLPREDAVIETEITIPHTGSNSTLMVARTGIRHEKSGLEADLLVVYDITRLKEYERAAARKERLSEMGDLAAGVAHEIRNPLNTISIAIQRLASEFVPEQKGDEFLDFTNKIRSETRRLNEIITRFLALTREESKRHRRIQIKPLITEVVSFVGLEAQRLRIEMTTDLKANTEVEVDPDQLRQVLVNLFNNSREAFDGREGKIRVSSEISVDRLVIRFDDNGPGIKSEIRDKVFSPYFTTKEAGTGLGLPTVYRIITDAGGDVTAGESPWGGAQFVITLPLAPPTG